MPYIEQRYRDKIDPMLNLATIVSFGPAPGPINYIITRIINIFLGNKPDYERFNAAIGILECAKLELYRRRIAVYEDVKRVENGDVYKSWEYEGRT